MKKGLFKKFQIKNIKFRERMLLIYIIGGIIPFFTATLYSNSRSRSIMLEQTRQAETEEISLICSRISQSMRVAEQVSGYIYGDEEVRQVISRLKKKEYKDQAEFDKDCRQMDFIDEYLDYFQEEISSIKIYVQDVDRASNHYITFVDSKEFSKVPWYNQTFSYQGRPFWSYDYDGKNMWKELHMTRCIPNERGEMQGILEVSLQMDKVFGKLKQRNATTTVLFGNEDLIISNSDIGEAEDYIIKQLKHLKKERNSQMIKYHMQDYLLTYERIYGGSDMEYYTVVSIQAYSSIIAKMSKANHITLITLIVGPLISIGLIVMFSMLFDSRMKSLLLQMHRVATGEYDQVEPLDGTDEVGLIYCELEKMMEDIKVLIEQVATERVQRERLHTRQKEVEFKMLADQINPHFIYNTLETIRMKAKMNHEPEIEELVKMLAKIMRRNIQAGAQMVTLRSELELTEYYLTIQEYRFGDRIHSEVIVDDNVNIECMVIPLIMQPFVENAFVHGLESIDEQGKLQIHVMNHEGEIHINIEDNGEGIGFYTLSKIRESLSEGAASESKHVGINNVNQRIRIRYGEEYGVTVDSRPGHGTKITLRFPEKPPEGNC